MHKFTQLNALALAADKISDEKVKKLMLKALEELDKDLEDGGFSSSDDFDEAYEKLDKLMVGEKVSEDLDEEVISTDEEVEEVEVEDEEVDVELDDEDDEDEDDDIELEDDEDDILYEDDDDE